MVQSLMVTGDERENGVDVSGGEEVVGDAGFCFFVWVRRWSCFVV